MSARLAALLAESAALHAAHDVAILAAPLAVATGELWYLTLAVDLAIEALEDELALKP